MFEVMRYAQENNTGQRQKSPKEQPYKGVFLWPADTHGISKEWNPAVCGVCLLLPSPWELLSTPPPTHTHNKTFMKLSQQRVRNRATWDILR